MQSSTPFPLLRTYLDVVRRKLRFLFINLLNIAGIVFTIIGFSTQNVVIEVVSVGGLVAGSAAIIISVVVWHSDVEDLRAQSLPELTLREMKSLKIPPRLTASGYEILYRKDRPSDSLLTSGRINRALFSGANSELKIESSRYRALHSAPVAHVLLRPFTQRKSILFNALKVRMASDPMFEGDSLAATRVQPTRYFETLMTNDSSSVRLISHKSRTEIFNGRDLCLPGHTVPACEQSACSNQVGASTIAITSDDYLVIVEQGRRSNIGQGLLASSGSGSADWKDIGTFTELQKFVKHFAMRELIEECGLVKDDVGWLRIIGYGRLLDRGGLPQFFGLAKLNCTFGKLQITRSERALTDYHNPVDIYGEDNSHYEAIQNAVKVLRKDGHRIFSSLWWNLEILSLLPESSIEEAFGNATRGSLGS